VAGEYRGSARGARGFDPGAGLFGQRNEISGRLTATTRRLTVRPLCEHAFDAREWELLWLIFSSRQ
jgi:hypothetical protein